MKNYSIARLNKVAEIGKTVSRRTGAGINISTFETTGTLFYGSYNRTVTQTYQITGTDLADTISIVVRHTDAIDDSTQVNLMAPCSRFSPSPMMMIPMHSML